MLKLVTVSNRAYARRALRLIESYFRFYPEGSLTLFTFDHFPFLVWRQLRQQYGERIRREEVPKECAHAHYPHFYFYKGYALQRSIAEEAPFLFLDAGCIINGSLAEIESEICGIGRYLCPSPPLPVFQNEKWTTKACFRAMKADEPRYHRAVQYSSGIQGYLPTSTNRQLLNELYQSLHDPLVAGPCSRKAKLKTDPNILGHRNDQSALSILIERHGLHQAFVKEKAMHQVADWPTLEKNSPELGKRPASGELPALLVRGMSGDEKQSFRLPLGSRMVNFLFRVWNEQFGNVRHCCR